MSESPYTGTDVTFGGAFSTNPPSPRLVKVAQPAQKPRRQWRNTKASLLGRIAELESGLEVRTQAHYVACARAIKHEGRADFWRRLCLCTAALALTLGVLAWV